VSFNLAIAAAGALELGAVDLSSGLSRDKFQALVGQNFQLSTPKSGVVVLQLVELRHYPLTPGELATENFTLYFKGASSPRLAESLYRLEHGSAGSALLRLEARAIHLDERALIARSACLFA
jgi:hypothetical protein